MTSWLLAASAKTVKDGELSVGMELSYAPAEFYAEDGKTPVGYDVDMSKAIAQTLGLKPKIVSSMFDTIVPSIGSKYDLGITAMTITEERLQSVDFVSYYRAGSTWAVQKGNPKKLDTSDMCGAKIAVQTGTVQEDEANKTAKGCKADQEGQVMSSSVRPKPPPQWPPVRPTSSTPIRRSPATRSPRPTASLRRSATLKAWPTGIAIKKGDQQPTRPCRRPSEADG